MPVRITNITDAPHQNHTVLFEESEIVITLQFHPTIEMWVIDAVYKDEQALGYKLTVGVLHMQSRNLPFDFIVRDAQQSGLDPFLIDDFSNGRCELYMLNAEDMESIRGTPVPL